jgi:glycosyltransferase involved in cell wall biosynthesis
MSVIFSISKFIYTHLPLVHKALVKLLNFFKIDKILNRSKPISKVVNSGISKQIENGEKKKSRSHIAKLKRKLYGDGFSERAYSDFNIIAATHKNKFMQQEAAWELALWHANKETPEDARKCLHYLAQVLDGNSERIRVQRAAVIKAECLDLSGEVKEAEIGLKEVLETEKSADLFLAYANLSTSIEEKAEWLNKAFSLYDLSLVEVSKDADLPAFFRLISAKLPFSALKAKGDTPLVTVIIPAYNCESTIHYALNSLLSQTLQSFEIIVSDDCSEDNAIAVVADYMEKDSRIRLIRSEVNSGPYVARNLALAQARGEFVTCHDADDWSHPERLEIQVRHLVQNPGCIANMSQWTRVTGDMKFVRRGNAGYYIQYNMASLMFRRKEVIERLGSWDSVRFGADGEMVQRMVKEFGEDSLVRLETGPLSLALQSQDSLTGNSMFGYHGYFMGARKEYLDAFQTFIKKGESLKYDFPMTERKFPVPEPMWPVREEKINNTRHFDVIIASEFRLPGGTTSSNIEEIRAHKALGLKTGLFQMNRYDLSSVTSINEKVRNEIDGKQVQMLVYGENVTCDLLIIRHPPALQEYQQFLPFVSAEQVVVVINTSPLRDYSEGGQRIYDFNSCNENLLRYFGKEALWFPIGPLVREAVLNEENIGNVIRLAEKNWHNIINTKEWYTGAPRCKGKAAIIGRHSRDHYVKWPENKEELLEIYPDDDRFIVKVLGGANTVETMLGKFPDNWEVYPFGSKNAKDFLSEIDFCVYYHHKDLVEAFGRTPLEAMAAGVPVILPEHFQVLFKEAAIYAKPSEVKSIILDLFNNQALYRERAEIARKFAEEHFGYSQHLSRIRPFVRKLQ